MTKTKYVPPEPRRAERTILPNAKCGCGSGKKKKKCHPDAANGDSFYQAGSRMEFEEPFPVLKV